MDINMPVMSGLDALRIIRAEDPAARVLMCSAIAENGIIRRGLSSGAVGYITKPFKPETVLDAVSYLVAQTAKKKTPVKPGDSTVPGALGIYRVDKVLGEGGMAVVYSGFDPGLGRKVAIKVMMDKYAADVDLVVRFLEEARAVARVSHSNVVSVYAAGSDRGKHYFAMEFLPGPDLEEFVYRTGPLPPAEALANVRQGAMGLAAAAEKGLIHCDVKPSNLVFGDDGKVKITDFGIAQKAGTEDDPTISEMVGTPCFMSPEQVQEQAIDHRADIYSLGTTLYYLLAGDPPYDGDDGVAVALRQVHDPVPQVAGAPRKLNKLLATMMAKSPDARFATYADLIAAIDKLL
jgi:serine/threonine-protein kinase